MRLGVHVSIAGSIDRAVDRAAALGCDLFQVFTRSPRGWRARDLLPSEQESFVKKLHESGMGPIAAHMPYLPNLASPRSEVYARSVEVLAEEMTRCSALNIAYLVTHPGSHLGEGKGEGIRRVAEGINEATGRAKSSVTILIENTAGGKNVLGGSFTDIASILDMAVAGDVGVCLDTCHLLSAGWEIRNDQGLQETLSAMDESFGLSRIKLVHLNDSVGARGSRIDRHQHLGLGAIGECGFKTIINHQHLKGLPMILETPVNSIRDDRRNLAFARALSGCV